MNKLAAVAIALSLLIMPGIGICESNGWTGNLNAFVGYKNQTDGFFRPEVDDHFELGLQLDFKSSNWPVSIAIDGFRSVSGETTLWAAATLGLVTAESRTQEIHFGIRKIWDDSPHLRPFIGGGIAYVKNEIDGEILFKDFSDDDAGVGFWLDAGFYWTFARHLNLGLDLRYSYAEVKLLDEDVNAGGFHAGVIIGIHW